jgi:hypothetical protein
MREHDTGDIARHGGIPLGVIQKYLNFHYSVSLGLFGGEGIVSVEPPALTALNHDLRLPRSPAGPEDVSVVFRGRVGHVCRDVQRLRVSRRPPGPGRPGW